MKELSVKHATASLAEYARGLNGEALIVSDGGKPIAALVPVVAGDRESLGVGTNPKFLEIIERSRLRQQAEGGISSEEMRRRLGLEKKPARAKPKPSRRRST